MRDCVVGQMVLREQYADAGLSPVIVGTELVELRDGLHRFVTLPKLQVSFREKIEILRLPGMLFDLGIEFCNVELRPFLRRQRGTIIQVVKKMLVRIRTS